MVLTLTLLLVVQCLTLSVTAAGDLRLAVITPTARQPPGDEFEASVSLENNPGIVVFCLYLRYDNTRFEYVSVTKGSILGTQTLDISDGVYFDAQAVRVTNGLRTAPFTGNGALYTVKFRVKENAPGGEANFSLTFREGDIVGEPIYSEAEGKYLSNNFAPTVVDGKVTVEGAEPQTGDPPTVLPGGATSPGGGGDEQETVAILPPVIPAIDGNTYINPYTDINLAAWYAPAVQYVTEEGLMNGTGMDRFSPNDSMTRAMFATVLYRMAGQPAATGTPPFADVPAGQWYSDAITWASDNEIILGFGNRRFAPNDNVTREQIVTILYRYTEKSGMDASGRADLARYGDAGKISGWALTAMQWAVQSGVMTGRSENSLAPLENMNRAEVAQILVNYSKYSKYTNNSNNSNI